MKIQFLSVADLNNSFDLSLEINCNDWRFFFFQNQLFVLHWVCVLISHTHIALIQIINRFKGMISLFIKVQKKNYNFLFMSKVYMLISLFWKNMVDNIFCKQLYLPPSFNYTSYMVLWICKEPLTPVYDNKLKLLTAAWNYCGFNMNSMDEAIMAFGRPRSFKVRNLAGISDGFIYRGKYILS